MMTPVEFRLASEQLSIEAALERLWYYPVPTLDRYDLPGKEDPNVLTRADVVRTRALASRISNREADWFVETAQDAPWSMVEVDAELGESAPGTAGFIAMNDLYRHFLTRRLRGVALGKLHKVLHLCRPRLYPILDSKLWAVYAPAQKRVAQRYPELSGRFDRRQRTWVAIHEDIKASKAAFAALRVAIRRNQLPAEHRLTPEQQSRSITNFDKVSDVRILDALAWRGEPQPR
jgi:hypothetical protein